MKNLHIDESETEKGEVLIQVKAIQKYLEVEEKMKSLTEALKELESVSGKDKCDKVNLVKKEKQEDVNHILLEARSMKEITEKVSEFHYKQDDGLVECLICLETFKYDGSLLNDFTEGKMEVKFSSLKRNLKEHFNTLKHRRCAQQQEKADEQCVREDRRSMAVGMRIGRIVYHLIYHGRPDTDLPLLIYSHHKAGADMGDINHSEGLVAKLLPDVAGVVSGKLKHFLNTRMVATGELPPINVMADKATHNRDTRQYVGLLTYNPGGDTLYKAFFLDAPKCPKGDGDYLTSNIVGVLDSYGVVNSQYSGFSGDGVYDRTKVGTKLDQHYRRRSFFTWDLMHVAALVDTAMRNPKASHCKQFDWINRITETIGLGISFVKWGQEWAHFFDVYHTLITEGEEKAFLRPKNFSETKFANWVKAVYSRFRDIYKPLTITLEETKEQCRNGNSTEREKAAKADVVMGKIYNATFVLSLSALVDIYTVYSDLTNFLQEVNIMPFDRMDKFQHRLADYSTMLGHIDPVDCPCSVFACTSTYEVSEVMGVDGKEEEVKGILEAVCSWPTFHGNLREYNGNQTYKKVILGALREDGSKTREGFSVQAANKVLNKESVFNNVFSRARDVASFLYEGLKERVYNNEDVIVIGKMRRILDLKSSMKRLEIHGAARISNLEW